ncbi:MAG: diguanylate cyclase [Actinomycetota bacterium]|nr:diguanylate cyclase [Actinomycetota bacterium]
MTSGREGSRPAAIASLGDVRAVIDHAHEAFVAMDGGGLVIDWNAQAERTFGYSRKDALGQVLAQLIIPPRDRAAHLEGLRRYLETGEGPVLDKRLELSAIDRTGHEFPIEVTISRQPGPGPPRFCAFLHDISERRLAERLLRVQHAISSVFAEAQDPAAAMRALLAGVGEALDCQLAAWWALHARDRVLRCEALWRSDPAVAAEFERASLHLELRSGVGLPGRVWASGQPAWTADLAADASFPRAQAAARAGLHGSVSVPVHSGEHFRGAIEFFSTQAREPDPATREILTTIAAQIGGLLGLLDERAALLAKLEHLALTDELTGLPNRRAWQQTLTRELARAQRDRQPLCVALLDLDHFKAYNDTHGHQAGDQALADTAHAWATQLRAGDFLARCGGEEFALLLPNLALAPAAAVLARVRDATPRRQTCSAGLVAYDGSETHQQLINRADEALYGAKTGGRDRTVTATTITHTQRPPRA